MNTVPVCGEFTQQRRLFLMSFLEGCCIVYLHVMWCTVWTPSQWIPFLLGILIW